MSERAESPLIEWQRLSAPKLTLVQLMLVLASHVLHERKLKIIVRLLTIISLLTFRVATVALVIHSAFLCCRTCIAAIVTGRGPRTLAARMLALICCLHSFTSFPVGSQS